MNFLTKSTIKGYLRYIQFIFFCKNIQKVVFVLCRISKNTDTNLFFLHIMCYNNKVGNKSRIWLARLKG